MKPLVLALVAFAAAACGSSNGTDFGPTIDEFGCHYDCGQHGCPPEAQCISAPYEPTCLPTCTSTADCEVGFKCALIFGNESRGPVCLAGGLTVCHQPDCSMIQPMCKDATTQLKPLSKTSCGWELVTCDNGCDSATGSCK